MFQQLLLPIRYSEPTDFKEIITECNEYTIRWLKTWDYSSSVHLACLIGTSSRLIASVWSIVNQARTLSNDNRMLDDWYAIIDSKHKAKSYLMINPERIKNEELFLHLINLVKERTSHLLFVSDIKPDQWSFFTPDIKSRITTINVLKC